MVADDVDEGVAFSYSPEDEDEPVVTIVQAVAWVNNVDHQELDSLYNAVDVSALNELVSPRPGVGYRDSSGPRSDSLELSFEYEGCEVRVRDDCVIVKRRH